MSDNFDFKEVSGNKFSLRSKSLNQIHKVDSLGRFLGELNNILVTTWGGIYMSVATLGVGGLIVYQIVQAYGGVLWVKNLPAIFFVLIGIVLVALNVVLTNPSFGPQLVVSIKFLINKVKRRNIGTDPQEMDMFKLMDDEKKIIEFNDEGKIYYLSLFSVRGAVSPVSFDSELNDIASENRKLLSNLERDTTMIIVNTIQKAEIKKKNLPQNSTLAMVTKRNEKFERIQSLRHNQQLNTLVIISSKNYNSLLVKTESAKISFRKGLVIGYSQLSGRNLKNEIYKIYGKKQV